MIQDPLSCFINIRITPIRDATLILRNALSKTPCLVRTIIFPEYNWWSPSFCYHFTKFILLSKHAIVYTKKHSLIHLDMIIFPNQIIFNSFCAHFFRKTVFFYVQENVFAILLHVVCYFRTCCPYKWGNGLFWGQVRRSFIRVRSFIGERSY